VKNDQEWHIGKPIAYQKNKGFSEEVATKVKNDFLEATCPGIKYQTTFHPLAKFESKQTISCTLE
jgi:hypothetical protein